MKHIILSLGILALLNACGAAPSSSTTAEAGFRKPDMYSCKTDHNLLVSYSTTSLLGAPEMSVNQVLGARTLQLASAMGQNVQLKHEADGDVVSIVLNIPDHSRTIWELKLPTNIVLDAQFQAQFETTLRQTTQPTSIIGPLPGQVERVELQHATCEASFVLF